MHWAFDETGGAVTAQDSTANNRDGSIAGATIDQPGRLGGAYLFGGSNQLVDALNYTGVTGTASRTASAWIRATNHGYVICWGQLVNGARFSLAVNTATTGVQYALRIEIGGGYRIGTTPLNDDTWHHVAAVLVDDGSPDVSEVLLYVDGALEAQTAASPLAINTVADRNVRVGLRLNDGQQFDGLIDDVSIWSEALLAERVRALCELGQPASVGYHAGQARQLFDVFDAGSGLATIDGKTWEYVAGGLTGGLGEVRNLGGGQFDLRLGADGSGLRTGAPAPPGSTAGLISEFMAINDTGHTDDDGDTPDWIEIHNASITQSLELGGWRLTDDPRQPAQWTFPAGVLVPPEGYLVVFASDKDRGTSLTVLHTNFRLSGGGDFLALYDDAGTTKSAFAPTFPAQFSDMSYGIPVPPASVTYLATPTPGAPNSAAASLGPLISGAGHRPNSPLAAEELVVTATVSQLLGPVSAVRLTYRVNFGAEVGPLAMTAGGGGIYTATIPSAAYNAGEMVRWFIAAEDTSARTSRSPRFHDPTGSPEYYGTLVADPAVASNLPVWHWWCADPAAANTRTGTRSPVFFRGEFYDNVFTRIRGGSSASLAKKSYKFDFNRGDHLRFDPRFGRAEEINLNTTYTDKSFVRQNLGFEIFDAIGAPGCEAFPLRVQQNGAFFSVAALIEQPDDHLLEREGYDPEGALYKMFNAFTSATSGVEKKTRRTENHDDLAAFVSNMNGLTGPALTNYVFDNVNVPRMLNYLAGNSLTQNGDCMGKNYYLYRDTNGTGEWMFLPWDVDLTFGHHFMTVDSILGDIIWADKDYVLGGRNADTPISPSHPFMGRQELPGNRSWNRLIHHLLDVPEFREMLRRRLRTTMDQVLQPPGTPAAQRLLETRLDELAALIGADAALDVARWGQYGTPRTLAEAHDLIKTQYLDVHRTHLYVTHLVDNLASYPEPNAYSAELPGAQVAHPAIQFGAIEFNPPSANQDEEYIELINPTAAAADVSNWRLALGVDFTFQPGTVIVAGGRLYVSPNVPVFRARAASPTGGEGHFVQGNYSGQLSSWGETLALVAADGTTVAETTYIGAPSDPQRYLRVTRVHYHPAAPTAAEVIAGFTDDSAFEYLELANVSATVTLDLTGVHFTQGVIFYFSGSAVTSLAPGQSVIVARNRAGFEARAPGGELIAGAFESGALDNDGDTLKIEDATNSTIQQFTYGDANDPGWPTTPDGLGPWLEVIDTGGDYNDPTNWRAGMLAGPTVRNLAATNVTENSATLNGEVAAAGAENPTVRLYWGATDGGTVGASWEHNVNLGVLGPGAFAHPLAGLTPNTGYYFRVYASNPAGEAWAVQSAFFLSSTGATYTLTTSSQRGAVLRQPDQPAFLAGAQVILTPAPNDNYAFTGWVGDIPAGSETDNPLTVTMDRDRAITARFEPIPRPLNANSHWILY